jgi:signal transduction histidine kinase
MHRATISVADRQGGGAVFTIRFPGAIEAAATTERQLETAL